MQTCSEYLDLAQTHGKKWQKMLQHERDQRLRLEDMVEQLARQLGGLEQAAKEHSIPIRDRSSECCLVMLVALAVLCTYLISMEYTKCKVNLF